MILYFDPFMGMAGDMTVSALVDAGAEAPAVNEALGSLGLAGLAFSFQKVRRQGLSATYGTVTYPPEHGHRHLAEILALIGRAAMPEEAREMAARTFTRLAEAEANVHGSSVQEVHFHEVGAADAIADVVGACAAWASLGSPAALCGPLNLGSGFTVMEHGTFPVPPPAVVELLKGVPVFSFGEPVERTTPTGAALAVTLCGSFGPLPRGAVRAVGYGAGTKDTAGAPNVLRVLLLAEQPGESLVSLLECQIDDMSPEVLGGALEALRAAGALDVFVAPVQAKKGRPAWKVDVVCRPGDEARLADMILESTTTTGVRSCRWERRESRRETRTVETPAGAVQVKAVTLPSGRVRLHPEWEDVKRLAEKEGVPPLEMADRLAKLLP